MCFSRTFVAPVMVLALAGRLLVHDYWLGPDRLAGAPGTNWPCR